MPDEEQDPISQEAELSLPAGSGGELEAEGVAAPEADAPRETEPVPMIDVHAPHETIHTWKDFLLHIATIVIGLLIAVGLEQTVELYHHRRDVEETREVLRVERDSNRALYARQTVYFRRETAALENDLNVLVYAQRHPGTQQAQLPGILVWHSMLGEFPESAWTTAQQANVTALMSQAEVQGYAGLYAQLHLIDKRYEDYEAALFQAVQYNVQDADPTHLSPADLAREIDLTKTVLVSHLQHGVMLYDLAVTYPDFSPGLQLADLYTVIHSADEDNPALAAARALTVAKIDAAGRAKDYFPQAGK